MSKPIRAAIVGGGISGLSAAHALARRGIDVTVYEQAPALGEVGAGVFTYPNALRPLERMGLGPAFARVGAKGGAGSEYYRMHRADLLNIFANVLLASAVRTGHRCVGFEQDQRAAYVKFDNGNIAEADIVIACDGINSTLQKFVVE